MYVSKAQEKFARVGLYDAVRLNQDKIDQEWQLLLPHNITTKQAYEEVQTYGEFGFAQEVKEGQGVTYDSYVNGYNKTFRPVIRALAFKASKQALAMDRYDVVKRHGPAIANAIAATLNLLAANVYSTGFSGSDVLGPDGKTLFASDHPLYSGTASNLGNASNTSESLSNSSLQTMLVQLMKQKNHRGIPMPVNGKVDLIVPTDEVANANILVSSMHIPGSANNDTNWNRGRINRVIDSPYIALEDSTKSNMWALRASSKEQHTLFMLTRQGLTVDSDKDFDNIAMKFMAYREDVAGYFDWRGVRGSDA